ncbi:MAG: glycosyltransferase [Fusobacterium sp.]|nr:glycosyltransferase [Fusobacterium sp.]
MQEYLHTSLDSVINQTYKNLEIICVNDGSADNSLDILKEYQAKDARIKIIDQPNGGVSSARNAGIRAATGDYIMFLDPDDAYDVTLCEKVAAKIEAENSDIVMWAHARVKDGEIVSKEIKNIQRILKKRYRDNIRCQVALQINVWDRAFRHEFLIKNNILFPIGIKCAEDKIFCTLAYLKKPSFSYMDEILYYYTISREGSVTNQNPLAIKNDIAAYKYLCSTEEFKFTAKKMKLLLTNHFLAGAVTYYRNAFNPELKNEFTGDVKYFLDYIMSQYSIFECLQLKAFRKLLFLIMRNNFRP